MKTRITVQATLSVITLAALLLAVGCQKSISLQKDTVTGQSAVNFYLTDDPSLTFDQVWLDIQKVEIKAEDDAEVKHESEHQNEADDHDKSGDTSGGWMSLNIHPGVYNILKFRNGLDTLFTTGSFPAAHTLKKLRVTLGNKNSVVFNGNSFPLTVKNNDNFIVIKMDESAVSINSGGLTSFWIDIDAGQSIKLHGNEFELKPSVKLFCQDVTGRLEGRVLPKDAGAVVMAFNATDTATAKPESEGEFKFTGLKAGTYSVLYHSTTGGYRDTTIANVMVKTKEDGKLPTVTLHK